MYEYICIGIQTTNCININNLELNNGYPTEKYRKMEFHQRNHPDFTWVNPTV